MPGSSRTVQRDFAGGMFRSIAPELIPKNGAWDITNGLLQEDGAVNRRGGSGYRSTGPLLRPVTMLWDGLLAVGGQQTVAANDVGMAILNADGSFTSPGTAMPILEPGRVAVLDGKLYLPGGQVFDGSVTTAAAVAAPFYAVVANRLLAAHGDQVQFSGIVATAGAAPVFDPTDLHLIPGGVRILGIEGLRDSAMVFTTDGVWLISGLALNLTDADGNVQHRLDHYSHELVLWGDAGIASWEGSLVVPGTDAVWIVSLGVTSEAPQAFARISDPIATLYREYVAFGYRPGQATIYQGCYVLPIVSAGQVIDTLVCRLDLPGRPWTRLSGYGAGCMAYVRRVNPATRRPELIGGQIDGRILTEAWFTPGAGVEKDADGSTFTFAITTRDYPTGEFNRNTVTKLRASYTLEDPLADDPTIDASYLPRQPTLVGTKWGRFNWGVSLWSAGTSESVTLTPLTGGAPEDPFGDTPYSWRVAKQTRFARFRLVCDDATSKLTLRALELFVRASGRV